MSFSKPVLRRLWSVRCLTLLLSVVGVLPLVQADPARSGRDAALALAAAADADPLQPGLAADWKTQVHPDLSAFDAWTHKLANAKAAALAARVSATPPAALVEEGIRLARQRRNALLKFMHDDPARALAGAVPSDVRATLPAAVLAEIETPFSSLGDFTVTCVLPNRDDRAAQPALVRRIRLADGRTYPAHVYGRRLTMTTKRNVFLQGILLAGEAVLDVNTLRALPAAEAAAETRPARDVVTSVASSNGGAPVVAEAGGALYRFSSAGQLRYTERRLRAIEARRTAETVDADESKALLDDQAAPPAPASAYTTGVKNVLVIRVDFSDQTGDPKFRDYVDTVPTIRNVSETQVKPYYVRSSYQLTDLLTTVTTKLYRMPKTAVTYAVAGDNDGLHNDAELLASADYDLSVYDRVCVLFTFLGDIPQSKVTYGGLAQVGGPKLWINGEFDFRVVAHELGHTYGLVHGNLWQIPANDTNPASLSGETVEYGDDFDTMGANFANTQATDFNVWYKTQLDWLTDAANVQTITQSGTYRVYRFDGGSSIGITALKIVKDFTRNYYVSLRRNFTDNASMTHGVYVSWGYNTVGVQHNVLDMQTPGKSVTDAALPTGKVFRDETDQISIVPLAEGGAAPNQYEDVQITLGVGADVPVIAGPLTATGFINQPFTYQINATNSPTTFGATGLPDGLTLDTSTGIISGTPTVSGGFIVSLLAGNASGTGTAQLNLTILNSSTASVITSADVTTAFTSVPFSYTITATNSPTNFTATGLPTGLSLDPATGLITGTVTAPIGTYLATISAFNNVGGGSQSLTVHVSAPPLANVPANDNFANAQPILGISGFVTANNTNATKETGEPDHAFDGGGHSVWYTYTPTQDGSVIIDTLGSTFDTLLAVYTGASYADLRLVNGNDDYNPAYGTRSRVDFGATAGVTYYIAVDGSDRSGVPTGARGLVSLQFQLFDPLADPVISSGADIHGLAGRPFTYQIAASNTPTSFTVDGILPGYTFDAGTGLLTGTFPAQVGTVTILLGATNASGTGNANLNITTDPPVPVITSLLTATAQVGVNFVYNTTATNTPENYGAANLPAGLRVDVATGVISGAPLVEGTFQVTLTASNISGQGSSILTLTVNPATPVIKSAPTAQGQVGVPFSYRIDADNTTRTFGAAGLPSGLGVDTATGFITGTPALKGTYTVTLSATNAGGTGTSTLTLTILPAPSVVTSSLTATGQQGEPFSYQITGSDEPSRYSATGLPAALGLNPTTGVISGAPQAAGTYLITLSVTNAGGTGASSTLTLTVNPLTPVISSAATARGQVGRVFTYQITASTNPRSYDAAGLPDGLAVDVATGLISGTPTLKGTYRVTVSATNVGGTGTAVVTITILPAPSVVTSALTATGNQGAPFSYRITGTDDPTSFGAAPLPDGLTVNTGTGLISGTPAVTGTFQVTLSATNLGGTGTAVLSLRLIPLAPVINSASTATARIGQAFRFQATATNSPTSFTAEGLPAGLTINQATGLISGMSNIPGSYTVRLTAANETGAGRSSLLLTVARPAPVISGNGATANAALGASFTYQIIATNNPASYAAAGLPAGLKVDTATGVISGTPTKAGAYTVTLSAANGGGTGTARLTLKVVNIPIVSFMAPGTTLNRTQLEEGNAVKIRVIRTGGDINKAVTVAYRIKGGNTAGVDYKSLSGTVTIPAGAASAKIKVRAFDDGNADGNKTLKIKMLPSTNDTYVVGRPAQIKVRIIDADTQ